MAYSYTQLEKLWIAAGGPTHEAPLMAAIAMAESGGNPRAVNSTDNNGTQTSWGLWQISNGTHSKPVGNILSPKANARQAVLKYHSQGLRAWGTYTSGAYEKYMQGGAAPSASGGTPGESLIKEAEKFIGTPYVWGGTSPKGFDCSGLVQYSLEKVGLKNVPRTSEQQWAWVQHIKKSQLKPGDLVFYAGSDGTASQPGHVAIYAGGNQVIQAPETGMNVGKYPLTWAGQPVGYGRVPGITTAAFTGGTSGGGGGSGWLSDLENALAGGILGPFTGLAGSAGSAVNALTGIADVVVKVEHYISWFFVPNHWVRIFSGAAGSALVIMGVVSISRTGRSYSVQVPGVGGVPTPVGGQLAPAIGIAEVTVGAILLFVAFHNLPSNVKNFPDLLSHLQAQLQSGGTAG